MDEYDIEELLKEGKELEKRLREIKEVLAILSKIYGINIDLDEWMVKK